MVAKDEPIPLDATFIEVGGDSLRADDVLVSVKRQFGVTLDSRTLLSSMATLDVVSRLILDRQDSQRQLVGKISALSPTYFSRPSRLQPDGPVPAHSESPQIVPHGARNGTYPGTDGVALRSQPIQVGCTPGQRRFWFLNQLHPGNAAYHVVSAVNVTGPLNTDALWHALQATVTRHDALRTRFIAPGGNRSRLSNLWLSYLPSPC